jgi:hypothetical protein
MTVKFSVQVVDGFLDSIESTIGSSPNLVMYSGIGPAQTTDAPVNPVLLTMPLPSDWMLASSGGQKVLKGTWTATASGTGIVGHYRIYDQPMAICHEQGTVTFVGGNGDITLDNTNVATGQAVTIVSKTLSSSNL